MAIGDRLAVLRKGVVEQIGTSDELYTNPNNAFVSNFIGKMNFFNASLVDSNTAKIDATALTVTVSPERARLADDLKKGSEVLIGARPEQLEIVEEGGEGTIAATVQIIQHLGQVVRYEVVLDRAISPTPMEVDMPHYLSNVREQDSVFIRFKEGLPFLFNREEQN